MSNISTYLCPRCDYQTTRKSDMARHFGRVRLCVNKNNLVLTEDVKKIVLDDHIYHIPPPEPNPNPVSSAQPSIHAPVVNFQLMPPNMSSIEKMSLLLNYSKEDMKDISDHSS